MESSPFQNQCPIAPPASSSLVQYDQQEQLNQDLTVLCHKMVYATRLSENLDNSGQVPRSFVQCGRPLSKKSKSTATSGGTSTNSLIYGLTTESEFPHFYPQPFSTNHSEAGFDFSSSFPSKDMYVSSDSDRLNTMLSGCPRVFCSTTSGFLLISSSALLGVVCSCHRTNMSVLKFCEHSGVRNANPGYTAIVDSGDTIAQWRKLYFGRLQVRVPGDHCEWDWPEGFSGIFDGNISDLGLAKDYKQKKGSIKMNEDTAWKTINAGAAANGINTSAQDAMTMKEQKLYKYNVGYSPPILTKVSYETNKNSSTINTVDTRCRNNSMVDDWSRISSNVLSPAALSRKRYFHGTAQSDDFGIENRAKRKINHETSKKFELLKRKRLHCSIPRSGEVHIGESYSGTSSGHRAILFEQKAKPIVCHKYGIIINGSRRKQTKIVSIENVLIVAKRTSVTEKYKVLGLLQTKAEGHTGDEVGFYECCVNHAMLKQSNADDKDESTCSRTLEKSNDDDCTTGKKEESTCSRTEGYKDRKCFCSWSSVFHCHDGDYRCHVPQDQLNVWLHIHDHKSFPSRRLNSQKTEFEYDNREQYARFKQSKGWKHLLVYKSIIHGLGLYTSRFIPRGEMVVEYVGEVVGPRVADKREAEYQSGKKLQHKGACYLFKVDKEHIIDGTRKGGIARFVNHSCLPNCVAKVICVRNEKKVVFYADREIYPGEEVTYDYHFNKEDEGEKIPCKCRSTNCRRYLN